MPYTLFDGVIIDVPHNRSQSSRQRSPPAVPSSNRRTKTTSRVYSGDEALRRITEFLEAEDASSSSSSEEANDELDSSESSQQSEAEQEDEQEEEEGTRTEPVQRVRKKKRKRSGETPDPRDIAEWRDILNAKPTLDEDEENALAILTSDRVRIYTDDQRCNYCQFFEVYTSGVVAAWPCATANLRGKEPKCVACYMSKTDQCGMPVQSESSDDDSSVNETPIWGMGERRKRRRDDYTGSIIASEEGYSEATSLNSEYDFNPEREDTPPGESEAESDEETLFSASTSSSIAPENPTATESKRYARKRLRKSIRDLNLWVDTLLPHLGNPLRKVLSELKANERALGEEPHRIRR